MNKPLAVISCPIDTYSGYGARARDFVRALSNAKGNEWDIKILPQVWGNTKAGYLKEHGDSFFTPMVIGKLEKKPNVWVQITVPNEFQAVGDFNIGVTAAMETTLCHDTWVTGANNMDIVFTSSEHGKNSLINSMFDVENNETKEKSRLRITKPVEVLFEGVDSKTYDPKSEYKNTELINSLDSIKENFCFLFVGHWLQGEHTQDRKNIGGMIESFLETFKTQHTQPALIIKTQSANSSIMDQQAILEKIDFVRKKVKGRIPNVYLLHGELSDRDINNLYNHSKVKAMVNLTRGEGFGRPLLEFTTTGKPIIASGWSGHTDFLRSDLNLLVGGKLETVHPSAVVQKMIIPESKWFTFDDKEASKAFKSVYKNYKQNIIKSRTQKRITREHYSLEKMEELLKNYLDKYTPKFSVEQEFTPPKLELPKEIRLPKRKLTKVK